MLKRTQQTYHHQRNGLVERQNKILVKMLRVYCSRYMTDWDKHLPQVHAALNNRDQSFHDVDWQGESNAPDLLLSGILKEEDVAAGVRGASGQETTRIERAL